MKIFRSAAYAYIILGAHNLNDPSVRMYATNFVNHPDYDPSEIANDVALIELPEEVNYNGKIMDIDKRLGHVGGAKITKKFHYKNFILGIESHLKF